MMSASENKKKSVRGSGFLPRTAEVIIIDKQVKFDGNTFPRAWLRNIIDTKGRADVIACMVLAEIVFWYRGADIVENGKVIDRKRKFDGDYLQKSYGDLAVSLNLSKDQVRDALGRLEAKGFLKRDFRTIVVRGQKVSNVLYIVLFAWKIRDISVMPAVAAADKHDVSGDEGCAENLGEHRARKLGGTSLATDTSAGPMADKYKEHFIDGVLHI